MISIKRAAVGALVLRPANGGAAIKLHLACALPALRVRLAIARQGPAGPAGSAGPAGPAGPQGDPGISSTTWDYYAANWTTPPTQAGTTAAGAVYSYTLTGVTRYRLVPSPYVAAQDAFYSGWDSAALSGLIVSRG